MATTVQSGLDFVHRIFEDIQGLQESVQAVQQQVERERGERSAELANLADLLDRKVMIAQREHAQLAEKVNDLDSEAKRSFAAVAQELDGLKLRQSAQLESTKTHGERLDVLEGRTTNLERDTASKAAISELRALTVRVGDFESELAGKTSAGEHRAMVNKTTELESEFTERAVKAERQLQSIQQLLESTVSEVERRITIADHRALDGRVRAAENMLEQNRSDLQGKVGRVEFQEVDRNLSAVASDLEKVRTQVRHEQEAMGSRLHNLEREVPTKATQAEVDTMGKGFQDLDRAMRQTQTQLSELAKELLIKSARSDVESLGARLAGLEGAAGALERNLAKRTEEIERSLSEKASQRDFEFACARLSELELDVAQKAGRQDLVNATTSIWGILSPLDKALGPLEHRVAGGEERSDATWRRLETRLEEVVRRKAEVEHLQEVMMRLEGKADLNHAHDRIVSADGHTTFAI